MSAAIRQDTRDYQQLFLSDAPLIDLRAPCEFAKGSFANAVNLPLMSDIERQKVGTCYKRQGQQAAITLGHQLVQGDIKTQRIAKWQAFAESHPTTGYLFCFRGGLRSQIVQRWLAEQCIDYPMVIGGYKALRNFLLQTTESITQQSDFFLVSGLTGSAKTTLLLEQKQHLDLEGLANHRGSSFGRQVTPQPPQISFENQLAVELLKLQSKGFSQLLLEDECRLIGARSIPLCVYQKMQQAPIILLHESLDFRIQHIYQEYIVKMQNNFIMAKVADPFEQFSVYLLRSIDKIQKRLGNELYQNLRTKIQLALGQKQRNLAEQLHYDWIKSLLQSYYDPMYQFQLQKKKQRVIFQGTRKDVTQFIQEMTENMAALTLTR